MADLFQGYGEAVVAPATVTPAWDEMFAAPAGATAQIAARDAYQDL
ncbi:MAG: hypothetical protein LBT54_06250 [Bifidobacteriaceae bacterium]|jgi:hypothetical protein|nr:hypothetical protein [Bifidobacteriaceae bacterium]